ncbi:MAG: hypothetical protein LBF38_04150 [Deltaproteobacteria bacterium]|jgi:NitT/TauT family transport system substrate-binding protein|nr:hypothetical protein [Deltaproteobacteria bacterium]
MKRTPKPSLAFPVLALAFFLFLLACPGQAWSQDNGQVTQNPKNSLTVYTAMTATTAQLPLLGAIKRGWPEGGEAAIEYWNNLEDLRALVLDGQGDVWVGHLETLYRAAARGAPVSLVAVTVWRKFYFISAPLPGVEGSEAAHPKDVSELLSLAAKNNLTVTLSPQNSPQGNLLDELKNVHGAFPTQSLPPQQLILELIKGQRAIALMPEPMASLAVSKDPKLKIIGSLEEQYSKDFGGDGYLPQAGVAVNLNLAKNQPQLVSSLIGLMTQTVSELDGKPVSDKIALFPPEVLKAVGPEVLAASLTLEPLIIKSAHEVKDRINDFLRMAAPDAVSSDRAIPATFFFDPGAVTTSDKTSNGSTPGAPANAQ